MMNTVKNVIHSLGGGAGDVAKTVGGTSADLAKRIGNGTSVLARRVGNGTANLARRVGPTRGLIGLAIAGVAVGGTIFLVRYLRSRETELPLDAGQAGQAGATEGMSKRDLKAARTKRKNLHTHAHAQ
ncbi:MAG: hypothetical protein H6Q90_3687 [Deltaproteobacteria bacterium]|nr:hypothetical protein [Deltaproteobacteria bacterium]